MIEFQNNYFDELYKARSLRNKEATLEAAIKAE